MSLRENQSVREDLENMLDAGIVTYYFSALSFPVVIVYKKDGKPRFCVDCRDLNQSMKADRWSLTKIKEIFDELGGGGQPDIIYIGPLQPVLESTSERGRERKDYVHVQIRNI